VIARQGPIVRPIADIAWLAALLCSACTDELRSPGVLSDEAVVMGISISVIEDGPYSNDIAALPDDRPRAEVLPLDAVELDALVADVDGPLALDGAAWVLCGEGCLSSMALQGERTGALADCEADSASRSFACLAGRGKRPRVEMPLVYPEPDSPVVAGAHAFVRLAVIVGSADGPTTEECLRQLVKGPRTDLWGCAIGVRELPYGPRWVLPEVQRALGFSIDADDPELPPLVSRLLPPNAAPRVEEVRVVDRLEERDATALPRSVEDVLEVEAGAAVELEPVVSARDQQLELWKSDSDEWIGRYEQSFFSAWADAPVWDRDAVPALDVEGFTVRAPEDASAGTVHVYVVVQDGRAGVSWFTLELRVVAR
jgi:hypothetical protein